MPFQILALSGGGYLGLFTACILAEIEKQTGRPIAQSFDLIAGTSVGGIIALGLASEVPAERIRQLFWDRGEEIFSNRRRPKSSLGGFLELRRFFCRPKYKDDGLRRAVSDVLGNGTKLGEAKHRVLIPAVNMTKGSVQMFKTPHHPSFVRDHALRMVDIALATSAAPTFFPLAEIQDALFVDGGIVANAPDLCAVHEATHFLEQSRDDVHVLSIGTTTSQFSLSHATGRKLGAVSWVRGGRLFSTMISAQQQLTDFLLKHQLGDRYLRIDAMQSREQEADLALDVATAAARKTISGLAQGAYQNIAANPRFLAMLNHTPSAPTFFAGTQASAAR